MIYLSIIVAILFTATHALSQQLAFPTAEGYGRFASGGRGNGTTGYVCHVDSLGTGTTGSQVSGTPHHRGTYRYCLTQSGIRTVVFDVAGTINLDGSGRVSVLNGNITIAGQTAPGDGIAIRGSRLAFGSGISHAIARHIRVRLGSTGASNGNFDSMSIVSSNNVILDHVSATWARGGTDENMEVVNSTDVTIQWSIASEGLTNVGGAAYNLLMSGGLNNNISILHNLFSHATDRNPIMCCNGIQIVNNVLYKYGRGTIVLPLDAPLFVNYIKNYAKGTNDRPLVLYEWNDPYNAQTQVYIEDNIHPTYRATNGLAQDLIVRRDGATPYEIQIIGTPFNYPTIGSETDAFTAYNNIITNVGPTPSNRDPVDARLIQQLENDTGSTISTENDVGGYPTLSGPNRDFDTYDTDWDGIPDAWESLCNSSFSGSTTGGLNSSNTNDGNDILDWSSPTGAQASLEGYSKLEIYINEMAGDYEQDSCGGLLATGGDTDPPSTPTMSAPTVVSHTEIGLSWSTATDASGISTYTVLWCQDDGSETCTPVNSISPGNVTSYQHTGLTPETTYGYQVRAIDAASPPNNGEYSSPVVYATTDASPGPDITTGLVSHWSLDSVLTDEGSASATLSAVGSPGYVTGRISNAIDLSGSAQYLTTADNDGHDFGTSTGFSFALWFQPDVIGKQYLLSKGQSQGGSSDGIWFIEHGSVAGNFIAGISSDTWNNYCAVKAPLDISDGAWHHVAVNILRNASCTVSDIEIYIDGTLATNRSVQFSGANTNANISNDDPLWIGAENVSGSPASLFNGRIDDVRVYSRTLAVEDVQALVALGNADTQAPTDPANLVGVPLLDNDFFIPLIALSWDASTDNVGPITYRIQRCAGNGCSDFSDLSTSISNSHLDEFLQEHQYYRYRVRAEDAVPNVSNYTSPIQVLTLYSVVPPASPSTLTTSYAGSVAFPTVAASLATTANTTVSGFSNPSNLGTTADSTVTLPSPPTGVTTP